MKFAAFNARCPFELGDKIRDEAGREHTITDIVALHSMKEMKVRFVYELDNSRRPGHAGRGFPFASACVTVVYILHKITVVYLWIILPLCPLTFSCYGSII